MLWDLILWIIFFFINVALLASTFYQILCLSDLEADYMNPYESSSRINSIVVPDFILQGVLCVLFLLTWHWFLFLVSVPITCYNAMLFMKRQHLIDVTEVFRTLSAEKKYRIAKLAFYLFLFIIVIVRILAAGSLLLYQSEDEIDIRLVISIFNSVIDEEEAVHIF